MLKTLHGEINNAEIAKVETKAQEEQTFEEAEVIMKQGKHYYFQIGRETIVRGLLKTGKVIDMEGG